MAGASAEAVFMPRLQLPGVIAALSLMLAPAAITAPVGAPNARDGKSGDAYGGAVLYSLLYGFRPSRLVMPYWGFGVGVGGGVIDTPDRSNTQIAFAGQQVFGLRLDGMGPWSSDLAVRRLGVWTNDLDLSSTDVTARISYGW